MRIAVRPLWKYLPTIFGTAIGGIWLAFCIVLYINLPVSPDQSLFDYISWSVLSGQRLYADVFEINWPGKIIIHMFGTFLFGPETWSFRTIDTILLFFITTGMSLFLRRSGFILASLIVIALYPALYVSSGAWMAGQRDIVAAGVLIAAVGFALPPATYERARAIELVLAGAFIAFAVLIRPTVLPFIIGLLAIERVRLSETPADHGSMRRSLLIAVGFLGGLGGLAVCTAWFGSLSGWFNQAFLFNTEVYVNEAPTTALLDQFIFLMTTSWHWLAIFSALSLLIWIGQDRLSYGVVVILGLMATIIVSFIAQNKGFGYHLGGFLTVFAFLNALLIEQLAQYWRVMPKHALGRAFLLIMIAAVVGGTFKKTMALWPEAERLMTGERDPAQQTLVTIAGIVAENSSSDDTFLQWGRAYHAPYLAERFAPWPFVNIPLRYSAHLSSAWPHWQRLAETGLRDQPPAFVLVSRSDLLVPADKHPPLMIMMLSHVKDYEVAYETQSFILYRRPDIWTPAETSD